MNQHSPQAFNALQNRSSIQSYLENLHRQFAALFAGEVASYIPELTRADPAWFGIALVTVDGHVYQVGDSLRNFTIQSVSKAITYGLALGGWAVPSPAKCTPPAPTSWWTIIEPRLLRRHWSPN